MIYTPGSVYADGQFSRQCS